MNNSQQLIKKDQSQVFPKTFLDAIRSRETGTSLEEILKGFNMYFVSYTGNSVQTRNQVPMELRRKGLWLTYINFKNEVITEWYDATDISNEAWGYDANWRKGSNKLVGDLTISADGYWVVNGVKLNTKAQGEAGVTPLLRLNNNKLEVSYNKGKKWNPLSDYIAAWFKWVTTDSKNEIGKIQISRDQKNWEDLSFTFTNNLSIKGYVKTELNLPTNANQGDIYMVGTEAPFTMYIRNSNQWVSNGQFTSIAAGITQEITNSEITVPSNKAIKDNLGYIESSPEYLRVLIDAEGKVLFGINLDGHVCLFTSKVQNLQTTQMTVGDFITSSYINNEYLYAMLDAENKVILGIKKNGSLEFRGTAPQFPTKTQVEDLSTEVVNIHQSLSQSQLLYLFNIADKNTVDYKTDFTQEVYMKKTEFIDGHSIYDDFIECIFDNNGILISAITKDGKRI